MNREFFINIIFLVSINLLIKPFFIFGIDRTVQNTVGAETYGIYFALLNFTYLMQIINDFGINSFNSRNISQHNQLLDKYLPNILIVKGFLGVVYLLVTFAIAWFSGYGVYFHLLLFIAINQLLVSLIFYLRSNISGLALYRIDSFLSALDKLLMIIICSVLLWVHPFSDNFKIEYFIYAQTISLSLTVMFAFFIVNKHLKKLSFRFRASFIKLIFKQSYPYALVVFLMTVYTRIDAVMIERMLIDGKLEAGIYASAYRLLDASNMLAFLFAGLLLPMFSKLIKEKTGIGSLLQFSFQMIWAGSITLVAATYFNSNDIMIFLYKDATFYWGNVLRYLMISFIALSGIQVYGTLLTANGSLMKMNAIFVIGVLINVILNYFFIQHFKAEGAAAATVITQFFVLIAQIRLVNKIFELQVNYSSVFRIAAYIFGMIAISWMFTFYSFFDWKVNFISTILAGLLLALIFKLIDIKMIRDLLATERGM
jgi:O-antigen/teichoic acid export membrane protein